MNRQIELPNFLNPDETKCKDGCGLDVGFEILIRIQAFIFILARKFNGSVSCQVNSGARCLKHNRDEGSADTSQHLKLTAIDCIFFLKKNGKRTQIDNIQVATTAVESKLFTGVGYLRYVKSGDNLVHLDCRTGNKICVW
jgi:uncharacterized protein YcbK (DUF882 family)